MRIYTGWAAINLPNEFKRLSDREYGMWSIREGAETCELYFNMLYLMSTVAGVENIRALIDRLDGRVFINPTINMRSVMDNKYCLDIFIDNMRIFFSDPFNIPTLDITNSRNRRQTLYGFLKEYAEQ